MTHRAVGLVLVAAALAACTSGAGEPDAGPPSVVDACVLLTPAVLEQLGPPGAVKQPFDSAGPSSAISSCNVDLAGDGTGDLSGDLSVALGVDRDGMYDEEWRAERCAQAGVRPSADGPGDASCLVVFPSDGLESRVDGWAWVGDGAEAYVGYQLIEPGVLPATAEADLRALLESAVEALPVG